MGIWQYCFSKHSSQLKVSPILYHDTDHASARRQSYRGSSDAVADRVEEIWIGLLKSKPGVEIRKKLSIKSSLLFSQKPRFSEHPEHLLSRKYKYHPVFHSISNLDLNPCFLWLIISLLCSLNANNTSTRLTTLSSLCEHVDNEYVAV